MLPGKTHTFSNPMVPKYSANIFSSVPGGRLQTYTEPFWGPLDIYPAICNKPLSYGRVETSFRFILLLKILKRYETDNIITGIKVQKNNANNGIQNKTSSKKVRINEWIE